ncbi:molybdenum cofactor guanylyltransferase [Niallia sp. FSL R7-0271]|uniref:molybdenum cofactor guanylyltransferase n=1 Tax=Niallia sp. FSL R7-0271 TaxID=2921678 RepID=UPI0030F6F9AD
MHQYIGTILAGGQSSRFGEHKAFARRKNKFFYQYSIEALQAITSKIYLVSHPAITDRFIAKEVTIIQDTPSFQGYGPLAGIYSVMEREQAEWYFVLPIDSPFITHQSMEVLLAHLEDEYEAIVPIVNEKPQPLISIYNFKIKKKLFSALKIQDLSMNSLLTQLHVKFVEEFNEDSFININEQRDYIKFIT